MINDRRLYLGGSDAAAVLGLSPWMTPYQLWRSKVAPLEEVPDPKREKLFARGKRLEPLVLDMLCDELGLVIPPITRNVRHADFEHPFLCCEIDAEPTIDGRVTNVEIKTVSAFAADGWGEQGTDEIPLHYAIQVLHGQMVTARERTIVAAFIGGDDLRIYEIKGDAGLIAQIRAREIKFWTENVEGGIAPDPVTAEDLKIRYPKDSGDPVEATEEIAFATVNLAMEKKEASALKKTIQERENKIKAFLKDAPALTYHGKTIATWKLQSREAFQVEAGEFRVLRIK